jgi:hypothetical protein
MKKLLLLAFTFLSFAAHAQEKIKEFENYNKTPQLLSALKKFDLIPFLADEVLFVFDGNETTMKPADVNKALKSHLKLPKRYVVAHASETNHGYSQTFGVYDADEVPLYFIALRISQLTQKIEEVRLSAN